MNLAVPPVPPFHHLTLYALMLHMLHKGDGDPHEDLAEWLGYIRDRVGQGPLPSEKPQATTTPAAKAASGPPAPPAAEASSGTTTTPAATATSESETTTAPAAMAPSESETTTAPAAMATSGPTQAAVATSGATATPAAMATSQLEATLPTLPEPEVSDGHGAGTLTESEKVAKLATLQEAQSLKCSKTRVPDSPGVSHISQCMAKVETACLKEGDGTGSLAHLDTMATASAAMAETSTLSEGEKALKELKDSLADGIVGALGGRSGGAVGKTANGAMQDLGSDHFFCPVFRQFTPCF